MAETLQRTADGGYRDSFGTTYRLASEGYVCPLKNRVIPLNTAASQDDEATPAKMPANELRYV